MPNRRTAESIYAEPRFADRDKRYRLRLFEVAALRNGGSAICDKCRKGVRFYEAEFNHDWSLQSAYGCAELPRNLQLIVVQCERNQSILCEPCHRKVKGDRKTLQEHLGFCTQCCEHIESALGAEGLKRIKEGSS